MELVGLEPTTSSLRTTRSPRLSYSPTKWMETTPEILAVLTVILQVSGRSNLQKISVRILGCDAASIIDT